MKISLSKTKKSGGYTLLFAVLVTSLVLSIGISILNISKKEFLLATSAKDSSIAFYAADSGVECAAYGDQRYSTFSTTTDQRSTLRCGSGMSPILPPTQGPAGVYKFNFSVKFGKEGESCSNITVTKEYVNDSLFTTIESRGYNMGWNSGNSSCDVQGPKKVERGLRLSY